MKFAGIDRLTQIFGLIKTAITTAVSGKADKATTLAGYGITDAIRLVKATCATEAAARQKVVTLVKSGETLKNGDILEVLFSVTNTYNSTAAAPITFKIGSDVYSIRYRNDDAYSTGTNTGLYGNSLYSIRYVVDVTNKKLVYHSKNWDNNTTYTNASLGQGYGTCTTAAATVAKVVSLGSYSLTTGGIVAVKFTNAVPAGATLNINSKGAKAVYYQNAAIKAGVIGAEDLAYFIYNGSQYHLIGIDSKISAGGSVGGSGGFESEFFKETISFGTESITETDASGNTLTTTFNANGTITQTLKNRSGAVQKTQTITFRSDGTISIS